VDICLELSQHFGDLVVNKLDELSRQAVLNKRDPATMVPLEQKRIHRAILQSVFGMSFSYVLSHYKSESVLFASVVDPGQQLFSCYVPDP
jgi:hypothetical protein